MSETTPYLILGAAAIVLLYLGLFLAMNPSKDSPIFKPPATDDLSEDERVRRQL